FGSYLEDVDFGLRCASKGYTGRYVPDAVSWHVGSATLGRWNAETVRQIAKNQLLLIARHYPPALIQEFAFQIALSHMLWGFVALRHGGGAAWIRGKLEGLRTFRQLRKPGSPNVRAIVTQSEEEIRQYQNGPESDWYWRAYFTGSRWSR
ncbi:MAG: hypothetical protein H7Y20_17355, partial [Bryobacteraceae bacterium]|nr:hypothetical protein [Bryobacteraceae bacterium]